MVRMAMAEPQMMNTGLVSARVKVPFWTYKQWIQRSISRLEQGIEIDNGMSHIEAILKFKHSAHLQCMEGSLDNEGPQTHAIRALLSDIIPAMESADTAQEHKAPDPGEVNI